MSAILAHVARSAEHVADIAHAAMIAEIETYPKPGLVSLVDNGSHRDMDYALLTRSAAAIRPFFGRLAAAGERRANIAELRRIGLAAEAAMMAATNGVNAHRGAIFSVGLLCAATGAGGYAPSEGAARACTVASLWGDKIQRGPSLALSNGGRAARRFKVGGARLEAAAGFPTLRQIGLPALGEGHRLQPSDPGAAHVHCLFALIAHLDDTNLLHRGGRPGLLFARSQAKLFLARGGVGSPAWREDAVDIHRAFVARDLSPGGAADLLAATLFLDALETGL